jgi:hypothetical protein
MQAPYSNQSSTHALVGFGRRPERARDCGDCVLQEEEEEKDKTVVLLLLLLLLLLIMRKHPGSRRSVLTHGLALPRTRRQRGKEKGMASMVSLLSILLTCWVGRVQFNQDKVEYRYALALWEKLVLGGK